MALVVYAYYCLLKAEYGICYIRCAKICREVGKAGMPSDQAAEITEAQKDACAKAMDTQLIPKSALMANGKPANQMERWLGIGARGSYRSTGKVTLIYFISIFVFKLSNRLFLH